MKRILLLATVFITVLVSCKNEDDKLSPSQAVLGTYQLTEKDFSEELDFVRIIELKQGQKVVYQTTAREKGGSEDLGFVNYFEGDFTLENDVLILNFTKTFSLTDPDITYVPKNELPEIERDYGFADRYTVSDDYMELFYVCPPNAFCTPPKPFEKIN